MAAREWLRSWYLAGGKARCGKRGIVLLQGRNPLTMIDIAPLEELRRLVSPPRLAGGLN